MGPHRRVFVALALVAMLAGQASAQAFPLKTNLSKALVMPRGHSGETGSGEGDRSMTIYERYVLPRLIHLAMRNKAARAERARFVPLASGTVLEVGVGSGLNVPFYGPKVRALFALDPSHELWTIARRRVAQAAFPVEFVPSSAERIPLGEMTVDTVVTTWTLCTIPKPAEALAEMRRVLKPDGRLIFVEHGRSPDRQVRVWQDRLDPVWTRVAGGCHLNRTIDDLIVAAGFRITEIERAYSRGPKAFSYLYKGLAQRLDGADGGSDAVA